MYFFNSSEKRHTQGNRGEKIIKIAHKFNIQKKNSNDCTLLQIYIDHKTYIL